MSFFRGQSWRRSAAFRLLGWPLLLGAFLCHSSAAVTVFHLKNGDQVSGWVLSENPDGVVVSNQWARTLNLPQAAILFRQELAAGGVSPTNTPALLLAARTNALAKAQPPLPRRWTGEAQVGLDFVDGENRQQMYNGRLKVSYEQPYASNPKQLFKDSLEYGVDYGRTDGVKSSDRMNGTDKADFDVGGKWYIYNLAGVGYDHLLKIDLQYEEGPGMGYHVLAAPDLLANLEGGVDYQVENRSGGNSIRDLFLRLAEDSHWKLRDRTTFAETFEFFPRVGLTEYRFRFESTLSYGLWRNFLLNFTLRDDYDSLPAVGVNNNEAEVRSSLGIKF